MRSLTFNREADEAMTIDMTPLVDCIFAIILFLLVSSSFIEAIEQDLSIELPKQGKAVKTVAPPARPIVVNVRHMPGGKAFYHVENEPLSLPALTVNLSRARVRNRDQAVVIRGDRNVRWENIAAVMSCCAQVGITKVSATVEVQENK
jgi:biopolymer transport protein ExbD